jgi:ATP synthase in type III secretion protein N
MSAALRRDLGTCALGRAIDARGLPLDGGPLLAGRQVLLTTIAPAPSERVPITEPFWTGVRVVDGLLTIGRGARVGIFGSPGCGKSMLIEAIVQDCAADAVVVALIGERGREAQRWVASLDDRTTVVCATSDRPAHERVTATQVAVVHADALRRRGLHVLLVIDSLARVAVAMREIAALAAESTGRGGYPPSVFAELARLVEVGGALGEGSITLVATVLSDGDDRDPVSEAARSLLDGHIALSTRLADAGRFPAVDVLGSTSRTMESVVDASQMEAARRVRTAIALLRRIEDARSLGIEPVDTCARAAIAAEGRLGAFLYQGRVRADRSETLSMLFEVSALLKDIDGDR